MKCFVSSRPTQRLLGALNADNADRQAPFLGSAPRLRLHGGPKNGARLMTIILSNVNRLKKNSLEDYWVNLQLSGY